MKENEPMTDHPPPLIRVGLSGPKKYNHDQERSPESLLHSLSFAVGLALADFFLHKILIPFLVKRVFAFQAWFGVCWCFVGLSFWVGLLRMIVSRSRIIIMTAIASLPPGWVIEFGRHCCCLFARRVQPWVGCWDCSEMVSLVNVRADGRRATTHFRTLWWE